MNPEDKTTEELSDVLTDRFDFIYMGYPETLDTEKEIVKAKGEQLAAFPDQLLSAALRFVRLLREDEQLEKKPSVRASIGLYTRAGANALLEGKKQVELKHIKAAVLSVLAHRIKLKPSSRYLLSQTEFIEERFKAFVKHTRLDEGQAKSKGGEG
jgi:MoxR-like ATPase